MLGIALALVGIVIAIGLQWAGVFSARRARRLPWIALDVGAGVLSLALGALAFSYFVLGCFSR